MHLVSQNADLWTKLEEQRSGLRSHFGATSAETETGGLKRDRPSSSTNITTRIDAASSEDKGCRPSMEDVAVLQQDASKGPLSTGRTSCYAIFDGHGGRNVAELASTLLHDNVMAVLQQNLQVGGEEGCQPEAKLLRKAVVEGFVSTDSAVLSQCKQRDWREGAACVSAWIFGETVLVANIGDAKAVLGREREAEEGSPVKAITLTREHKAIFPQERARIEKAGGVVSNGRLEGLSDWTARPVLASGLRWLLGRLLSR
eukprot:jgi/Botrbrau1/9866/Bobra.0080s0002.2